VQTGRKRQPGEDVVEVNAAAVQTMDRVAVMFPVQRNSVSVVQGYYYYCYYYYYHHHHHHRISHFSALAGNIHLSWDVVINSIRLGGLTCSLKSFLQLNMCHELQLFVDVYMYWGAS